MAEKSDPIFDNLFLRAIADALARRRKALRYGSKSLILDRGVDERNGVRFERLNLEWRFGLGDCRLQFTAWEDSQGWLCLLRHKKKVGWAFKLELRPELWDLDGPEIVQRIEAMRTHMPDHDGKADPEEEERIRKIWSSPQRSDSANRKKLK